MRRKLKSKFGVKEHGALPRVPKADPFRYGWRYVKKELANGQIDLVEVPLTLEDVLHPEEDDVIPEIDRHEQERGDLARWFRLKLPVEEGFLVLSDCIVNWGVEGIRNHSPDVSVFGGLRQPHDPTRGTFHLRPSGGRCLLAIEIVSPDKRNNDVVHKFDHYHRVGVPLYVVIDQEREGAPRRLLGYEHTPTGYRLLPLDEEGRLLLEPLGLKLGLRDNWVVCFDATTGEELGNYIAVARQREAEVKARKEAEKLARKEARARKAAAKQAREEAEAREVAEKRLREVEEELRRRRGESAE